MLEIIVIIFCLCLNAVFSCAEIAFVTAKRSSIKNLAKKGDKKAETLLYLREHPEKTLSVVQIAITFVAILAAAFGGSGAESLLTPRLAKRFSLSMDTASLLSIFAVVIPLTYFTVVFGELAPKIIGMKRSLHFSTKSARLFLFMSKIFYPIIKILEYSTKGLVKLFFYLFPLEKAGNEDGEYLELNILPSESRKYVLNIVDLESKALCEAMIPLNKVICIDRLKTLEEVEQIAVQSMHTRLPVYDQNELSGVLHTKELFSFIRIQSDKEWTILIRSLFRFDEKASVLNALLEMQKNQTHMAAVVNSSKQVIGIITLEDLIEEIVGDIYDEDDPTMTKRRA